MPAARRDDIGGLLLGGPSGRLAITRAAHSIWHQPVESPAGPDDLRFVYLAGIAA